jgi:copper chaperone CopZ
LKTVTLKIIGMHCTSCAINIDFELEDIEGVKEAKTHYAKQISEVTFDEQEISLGKIIETIRSLEYEVQPIYER